MPKQNNILDLSKLTERNRHKDLVELVYNLPCGVRANYLYGFIVFMLKKDNILGYLPKRIQNKTNKFLAEYEEQEAIKEQAEEKQTISEEQKEVNKCGSDLLCSIVEYVNSDTEYSEKVFVLEQVKMFMDNISRKESEV